MTDVRSMRWGADPTTGDAWVSLAADIVAWVNDDGGEARYEPDPTLPCDGPNCGRDHGGDIIAVRTRDGWAHCSPGQWVVKGEWSFGDGGIFGRYVREFTVENR